MTDKTYNQTMRLSAKFVCLGITVPLVLFGATPVARVISTQPINVDGIVGPARNFVPLAVGDEVTTDTAAAVVQFPDGSQVTLQPHSKLRIEGQPSGPAARVIQGSAIFDVARSSSTRLSNGKVKPIFRAPSGAPLSDLAPSRGASLDASGFIYRSPVTHQPGAIVPQTWAFTGSFSLRDSTAGAGPQIVGPNGVTINLTAVVNPTTGATTYVVSSVQQTITIPGGGTAVVTVTSGPLVGATVGGSTSGTSFTLTPPGSTTPLTSQQTATAMQTGVQQAINNGVANGTLPTGTQPPSPAPVTTGQFSPSGT
jgi:hypothetical protein